MTNVTTVFVDFIKRASCSYRGSDGVACSDYLMHSASPAKAGSAGGWANFPDLLPYVLIF
jgi:hypothetical protein